MEYQHLSISGLLSLLIVSVIAFILHCLLTGIFNYPSRKTAPIILIINQGKLILAIWIALLPLVYVLLMVLKAKIPQSPSYHEFVGYFSGIVIYGCLFFHYLSIYYIVDRSVSSSIMIAIDESKAKSLSIDNIKSLYGVNRKYLSELTGMVESGYLKLEDDYYRNTVKGKFIAKFLGIFKKIYHIGLGGY